jgi:hypothetical protein
MRTWLWIPAQRISVETFVDCLYEELFCEFCFSPHLPVVTHTFCFSPHLPVVTHTFCFSPHLPVVTHTFCFSPHLPVVTHTFCFSPHLPVVTHTFNTVQSYWTKRVSLHKYVKSVIVTATPVKSLGLSVWCRPVLNGITPKNGRVRQGILAV